MKKPTEPLFYFDGNNSERAEIKTKLFYCIDEMRRIKMAIAS